MKLKLCISISLLTLSFVALADDSIPQPAFSRIDTSSVAQCFTTINYNLDILNKFMVSIPWSNEAESEFYLNYTTAIGTISNPYAVQGVNSQCNSSNGVTTCTSTYPVNCQLLDSSTYPAQAGQIVAQQAQQEMNNYATGSYPNGVVPSLNAGTITCTFPGGTPFPYSSAACTVK